MFISYNWLKKHINLPDSISATDVAARLKASTVEVEGVEVQGKNLDGIVVGKILSAEKHPNADKLKVCTVDVGGEQLPIVCGGSNVNKGMLVALAKVAMPDGRQGAKVKWHSEGELVELKPVVIRGVESMGMICASTEIGLAEMFPLKEEKEILDLSPLFKEGTKGRSIDPTLTTTPCLPAGRLKREGIVGMPLAKALGLDDAVLEIDNKSLSNRPDLWGHYGIAREVAVLFNKKLKAPETVKIKTSKDIELNVEVKDAKLCPRYMAVTMSGVNVGPSPQWLQKSLLAVGQRPINNIVDITNFVMLDLGQPMHAFDASHISPKSKVQSLKSIEVRTAKDGEEFVTLDGQKRKLDSSMLMIADSEKSLAVAGVMGGLDSGITNNTTTIIFESANFDAASIRRTSTKLGLRSDSSARFEKSLDPNLTALALEKAVKLVLECCPKAKVASNVADESKFVLQQGPITVSMEFLQSKIGVEIPKKEVVKILENLGFAIKVKGDELLVVIPSWRATKDISIPEDLVEEVIRIYGFDKIDSQMPSFTITPPEENKLKMLERKIKNILVNSLAYTEVYNYSFVSPQTINKLGDDTAKYLELDNPLSKERPFLRRNLLPNLLENIKNNIENYPEVRIFEVGKVFSTKESGYRAESKGDNLLPKQDTWMAAAYVGKKDTTPFWQSRHALESIFSELKMDFKILPHDIVQPWEHPARLALISCNDKTLGVLCEINPLVLQNLGIEQRVSVLQLNLSALAELPEASRKYSPLVEFPAVERDLAISVKKGIAHADILAALLGTDPLLQSVELFDVYEGEIGNSPLGRGRGGLDGRKSMAYHFVYQDSKRTLVTEEVDKAHEKLIKILKEKFGAEVR